MLDWKKTDWLYYEIDRVATESQPEQSVGNSRYVVSITYTALIEQTVSSLAIDQESQTKLGIYKPSRDHISCCTTQQRLATGLRVAKHGAEDQSGYPDPAKIGGLTCTTAHYRLRSGAARTISRCKNNDNSQPVIPRI